MAENVIYDLNNTEFLIKQTRQRLVSNEYQMLLSPTILQKYFQLVHFTRKLPN